MHQAIGSGVAFGDKHLHGRGGGDHHIADVVDRGDQTRQLDDIGPVAIENQDGPRVDRIPVPAAVLKVTSPAVLFQTT
jgi:hypothetical protein